MILFLNFLKSNMSMCQVKLQNYVRQGIRFFLFDAIKFPLKEFLSRYFQGEGYKDVMELMLAMLMAFLPLFWYLVNLWEVNNLKIWMKPDEKLYGDRIYEYQEESSFWLTKPAKLMILKIQSKKRIQNNKKIALKLLLWKCFCYSQFQRSKKYIGVLASWRK